MAMKSEGVGSRAPVPPAGAGRGAVRSLMVWQVLSSLLLLAMAAGSTCTWSSRAVSTQRWASSSS